MGLMDGKVCIVTGGSGSLGLASARLFVREGARVMLVDLNEGDLKRAAAELGADNADYMAADVSQAVPTRGYIDKTMAKWGKLDVLFSNAGNQGAQSPIADFPEDNFNSLMAVHVKGAFLAAKYGLPHMTSGGSFIITSSVIGVRGAAGACSYTTAKHAQVGLMRSLAKEVGRRGIRVNTLHPGPIDNEFQLRIEQDISKAIGRDATQLINQNVPFGRHAAPEEIARSALYLASDLSIYTNGATLVVDGGMTA